MKLKINVKYFHPHCKLGVHDKGDWIDLRVATGVSATKGDYKRIPLGVAMRLPKGFEAIVCPRSSTFSSYGFIVPNSMGIIDNSYNGNRDQWVCPAFFLSDGEIKEGDRVCQFRIQLSQKASIWAKIRWLFCSGIKFKEVEGLSNINRGGFGSTGNL